MQSAVILAGKSEVTPEPLFREIDLGKWDGKTVAEIKRDYPEEYEARGRDIIGFKGHGGENYYDLRYRAFRGLRKHGFFCNESPAIIVTHQGVIRAVVSLFSGKPLCECMDINVSHGGFMII